MDTTVSGEVWEPENKVFLTSIKQEVTSDELLPNEEIPRVKEEYLLKFEEQIDTKDEVKTEPSETEEILDEWSTVEEKFPPKAENDSISSYCIDQKKHEHFKAYKCHMCDYEGRWKSRLKRHLLTHRDPKDINMFKCNNCDYQSKRKYCLKEHVLIHRDYQNAIMFKCDQCEYKTIWRNRLNKHHLRHSSNKATMFKCNQCDYQTRLKVDLKRHHLRHKDLTEVDVYKCDLCDFQTIRKNYLKWHALRHKYPAHTTFKCNQCDFQSSHGRFINVHLLRHENGKELVFQCHHCNYRTFLKSNLKRHIECRHTDSNQVNPITAVRFRNRRIPPQNKN